MLDVWADQPIRDYWFLDHEQSSRFDMDRLYDDRVSKVIRYSETAEAGKSDLQYLKEFNW